MDEYDFFELTGLTFDPPEKAAKKVEAAIKKLIEDLEKFSGNISQQLEKDALNSKLSYLKKIGAEIFSQDGKLNEAYEKLAESRKKQEIENLRAAVDLLKLSGKRVVTNGTIKAQKAKTKLSKDNIESVYKNAGFTITEIDPLSAMPKFPTNAERIYDDLAALRKSKDPNPNGADLTLAVDMYAFVAYLQEEPENAAEYRHKTSAELAKILEGHSKRLSTRNDNLGKLCASLATAGKTFIFSSDKDKDRHAYELHLLYKGKELSELFSILKRTNKSDLRDPAFADVCIRKITEVFGDGSMALAIYNNEAGLNDDPYIPEKAKFPVKCAHCLTLSEFEDISEAQKVNKCSQCGKALYQKCAQCNKPVLASADKCPECGFTFANPAMFTKYFAKAEEALSRGNFEEARRYLTNARSANPGEKGRTDELGKRITTEEAKYNAQRKAKEFAEHLSKAEEALRKGNFDEARQHLKKAIEVDPDQKATLSELTKKIEAKETEIESQKRSRDFSDYIAKAEKALREEKYDEARRFLENAKEIDPGQKAIISELERKIETTESKYQTLLKELKQLISEKKFMAGNKKIDQIKIDYKNPEVNTYKTEIDNTLVNVQKEFDAIKNLPDTDKANRCYDILDKCVDFEKAEDLLLRLPVSMPQGSIEENNDIDLKDKKVTIRWKQSSERRITYQVRREGKVLKDNITDNFFNDKDPLIGESYSYTVFAQRKRNDKQVLSSPWEKRLILTPEVEDLNISQNDNTAYINITWIPPRNCTGVTIKRSDKSTPNQIKGLNHYDDRDTKFNLHYEYIIKAEYPNGKQSKGVSKSFTPTETIEPFDIYEKKVGKDTYRISWKIPNKNVNLKIIVEDTKNDKKEYNVSSDKDYYDITLAANNEYDIKVMASDKVVSKEPLHKSTKPLQLDITWWWNPSSRGTKVRTVSVLMDSRNGKGKMKKQINTVFWAYGDKFTPNPAEPILAVIPQIYLTSPTDIHQFDFEIDPNDPKLEGKPLEKWNYRMRCKDEDDEYSGDVYKDSRRSSF